MAALTTRPPLERMIDLATRLRLGRHFNVNTVARRWEVSTKTIARDIEFMRTRLGYEIEWVQWSNSYRLRRAPIPRL